MVNPNELQNQLDQHVKSIYSGSYFSSIPTSGNTILYFDENGLLLIEFTVKFDQMSNSIFVEKYEYRDKLPLNGSTTVDC